MSCKKEETFASQKPRTWRAYMSRPALHPISDPKVVFFRNGKCISQTETTTDIGDFGWSYPIPGRQSAATDIVPDSVSVSYLALDGNRSMHRYSGGAKLPSAKIQELFEKGYTENGKKQSYSRLTVGLAPGGRACLWMDKLELMRFGVPQESSEAALSMTWQDSLEKAKINAYLDHHPIRVEVWEKSDPRIPLGFGFCSEDKNAELRFIEMYTGEGCYSIFTDYAVPSTEWETPYHQAPELSANEGYKTSEDDPNATVQLPVHLRLSWTVKGQLYCTDLPLPDDFSKYFPKDGSSSRVVVGVEKSGDIGKVWVEGKGGQKPVLRFRARKAIVSKGNMRSGGYAEILDL